MIGPPPVQHLPIRYPDQETFPAQKWHYDAEVLFVDNGTPYVLTNPFRNQQINTTEVRVG